MTELVIAGPAAVEAASDPAEYVLDACERAKMWLAQVLDHGDIEQIVELKSQAEAIRVYTMQKQLGKDAELSAAEVVRRAERGIGVAIRRGQAAGEIKTRADGGWQARNLDDLDKGKKTTGEFFGTSDERTATYVVTDGVTDERFDEVIAEAKAEGNLSRANVVRKIKTPPEKPKPPAPDRSREAVLERRERIRELADGALSSRQIAAELGITEQSVREIARQMGLVIPADQIVGGRRRHDPRRIVGEAVNGLEGLCMGLALLSTDDYDQLDPHDVQEWSSSLAKSLRSLNQLKKELNRG